MEMVVPVWEGDAVAIKKGYHSDGGDITLSDSPLGGLRATVRVPV